MIQPAFKAMLLIRCAAHGCSQYVKENGKAICEHTVLEHRVSPGETISICRKCWNQMAIRNSLLSHTSNWKFLKTVKPEPYEHL